MAASWGLFWGGWAALIPEIKADLALTDQQLGLALFAVPVAAVPAMVLTGRLAQRLAQHTLPVVTGVFALGVLLVGLSGSYLTFAASLLVVGAASGAIEVALNATMAAREARDGERLFNKVHAATPMAMVVAAPCVGLARQLGASALAVLAVIAVLVALSAVMAIDPNGWVDKSESTNAESSPRRFYVPLVVVGAVAATVLLMENAVEQWGAIHMETELAAGPLLASFAPAAYMAGLSAGRLLAQWRGAALGDRVLVVAGGALGLAGMVVGAAAWNPATTLIGFAVAGIGLAPVVPTLMGAVGRAVANDQRSKAISLVTTIGYAGFLSSPPLVGTLAGWLGLPVVLTVVAMFGLVVMAGAAALRLLPTPARAT
ncbi:MFS transporter [Allokutzneria sp. NRRL B-24872]|uniref:MFS transporter n=1 Tax=Allokutzneria sp. NRRL B-24872 TaxID=1137961 RepID=UPI000A391067|nr:MFS transporter [Allokutzneria sp. NRRL B-24872]